MNEPYYIGAEGYIWRAGRQVASAYRLSDEQLCELLNAAAASGANPRRSHAAKKNAPVPDVPGQQFFGFTGKTADAA